MSKYMHEMIISICTLDIIYTVLIRIARYNEPENNHPMCLCVCYHLISETKNFAIQTNNQWTEQNVKDQNYKDFVVKSIVVEKDIINNYGDFWRNVKFYYHKISYPYGNS